MSDTIQNIPTSGVPELGPVDQLVGYNIDGETVNFAVFNGLAGTLDTFDPEAEERVYHHIGKVYENFLPVCLNITIIPGVDTPLKLEVFPSDQVGPHTICHIS